eukprot:scaffold118490_cov31-Tisochrysis_lutea.AAC.4
MPLALRISSAPLGRCSSEALPTICDTFARMQQVARAKDARRTSEGALAVLSVPKAQVLPRGTCGRRQRSHGTAMPRPQLSGRRAYSKGCHAHPRLVVELVWPDEERSLHVGRLPPAIHMQELHARAAAESSDSSCFKQLVSSISVRAASHPRASKFSACSIARTGPTDPSSAAASDASIAERGACISTNRVACHLHANDFWAHRRTVASRTASEAARSASSAAMKPHKSLLVRTSDETAPVTDESSIDSRSLLPVFCGSSNACQSLSASAHSCAPGLSLIILLPPAG